MKKICIIGPLPPPMGGDAKAISTLLDSELFNSFFEIEVLNLSDGSLRSSGNKKLTFSKVKKIFDITAKIKKISKSNFIDTYYLTIAQTTFGSLRDIQILKTIYKYKSTSSKVVIHLHGGGFQNHMNNMSKFIKKSVVRYFSRVDSAIVLSKSLIKMFDGVIDKKKIKIVENCVDDKFLLSQKLIDNKLNILINKNHFKVLYLSNMIKSKGYIDLLEAARLISSYSKNISFIFAGPFPNKEDQNEFISYINKYCLADIVEYKGIVDGQEKYSLLSVCDLFVLPTYFPPEGQPISILESMGAAMPIITTNQGGILDVVTDKKNGIIIESKNPSLIKDAILDLINNKNLFKNIAKQNRETVLNNYTESSYITKMIDILN